MSGEYDSEDMRAEWLKLAPAPPALQTGKRWHVFLSYRSVHRGWVLHLYDILKDLGYEVFLDQFVLSPADRLVRSLEEGLTGSQSGVLIWSKRTEDSEWCRDEYEAMHTMEKEGRDFFFVVATLDDVKLPQFASQKIYLDFSEQRAGPMGSNLLRLLWGLQGKALPDAAVRLAAEVDEGVKEALAQIRALVDIGDGDGLVALASSTSMAWVTSPLLGSVAAEGLISVDRPDEALTVVDRLRHDFPKAVRPKQLEALARARSGDWQGGQRIVAVLRQEGEEDPETLGILARTWFDRYESTGDKRHLAHSRDLYSAAFERFPDNFYVGINAAAKSLFLDEADRASELAQRVEVLLAGGPHADYWAAATDGEASLIQRKFEKAAELYRHAVDAYPEATGSHASTWKQAKRLLAHLDPSDTQREAVAGAFAHLR